MPQDDTRIHEAVDRIIGKTGRVASPVKPHAESPVGSEARVRLEKLKRLIEDVDGARAKVCDVQSYLRWVRKSQTAMEVVRADTRPDAKSDDPFAGLRLDLHQTISPLGENPLKRPLASAIRESLKGPNGAVLEPKLSAINDALLQMADAFLVEPQRPFGSKHTHAAFNSPGLSKMLHDCAALIAVSADAAQKPNRRNPEWLAKALTLLKEHPEWSDRKIASKCGISPSTLSRSEPFKRMRAAGVSYKPPSGSKSDSGEVETWGDRDGVA